MQITAVLAVDFAWQEVHHPPGNQRILCGKNFQTQGFCVVKATNPKGKHKDSV